MEPKFFAEIDVLIMFRAYKGRKSFEEEHIGRAYKSYKDIKGHRKEMTELIEAQQNLKLEEARHTRYLNAVGFPLRPRPAEL